MYDQMKKIARDKKRKKTFKFLPFCYAEEQKKLKENGGVNKSTEAYIYLLFTFCSIHFLNGFIPTKIERITTECDSLLASLSWFLGQPAVNPCNGDQSSKKGKSGGADC